MYSYMIAKVNSINKKSIIIENNYIGYMVNVANPENFEQGKVKKVYIYKHLANGAKNNLIEDLYGFETAEKKMVFLHLICISGIGPKTAMAMCSNDIGLLKQTIVSRDVDSLATLNGFSLKYARLVIDNLADLYKEQVLSQNALPLEGLMTALKSLGYSSKDIDMAIKQIDPTTKNAELSDLISNSIKIIATTKNNNEQSTSR